MKAVKQWRYTPTLLSGTPVPVIMTVTVNFKHHFRFVLEDLGLHRFRSLLAVLCYGAAIVGTVVTAWILLRI